MKHKKYMLYVFIVFILSLHTYAQNNRNGYNTTMHQPPEVDFSWVNACLGDTTYFINGSIRGITYKWYIYNKNMSKLDSSTNINMSYFFLSADTFYVYLQADNGHLASALEMIIIGTVTSADFNFMHCSNQFINHSTCATSFFWNFGDGSISTSSLPTHQYADTGFYTVKFIASKGIYSDTITKQIFVGVNKFPTGAYTYYLSSDTLFVHALDSGAGMFYNWNFGDFTPHVYKRDTFHVYADTGTFILTLIDWNTCNQVFHSDTIRYYISANSITNYNSTKSSVSIFPNPVSSNSYLNFIYNAAEQSKAHLSLYNVFGQVIFENEYYFTTGKNEFKINTNNFLEGMYFIELRDDKVNTKIKFLVERN